MLFDFLNLYIFTPHADTSAGMYLQGNKSFSLTNLFIMQIHDLMSH